MKAKNTKEILTAAKWILENVGWIQGNFYKMDPTGNKYVGFCAVGALQQVEHDIDYGCDKAMNCLVEVIGVSLVYFNDAQGRTKEQVLAAFDTAIAAAETK